MNTSIQTGHKDLSSRKISGRVNHPDDRQLEMRLWLVILALCNLGLANGMPPAGLVFFPGAVADGQWWRILTGPFTHVSLYHLLLDGAAFLLLYQGLEESRRARRLLYVAAAGVGSLVLPLAIGGAIDTLGLCGLSGIAHGLMAVSALELGCRHPVRSPHFRTGALLLVGLVAKCVLELTTGTALFSSLHLGEVGTPIVASHAGGALGGLLGFCLFNRRAPCQVQSEE